MTPTYIERAYMFGKTESLFGVLSLPAEPSSSYRPAVVILNSGTTHRVGHHRMYASLARALAGEGYPVLRFDFAGIGDSRPSDDGAPLLDSNLADIRAAIDWLETRLKVRRFVLMGLCSGADCSVMYSHTDARIAGLVLLDPYIPNTPRYLLDFVRFRLANPRRIMQFRPAKSRLVRAIFESVLTPFGETSGLRHISFRGQNARAILESIYAKNVAAGVQILVFCTGSNVTPRQTYENQFIESFKNVDFAGHLQVHFLRDCDHLFSSPAARETLKDLVLEWVADAPSAGASAPGEGERQNSKAPAA